jgi:glycosyltransferase involved in cell wall biosynthesis
MSGVDITILVPTKNEELTVERFIRWCQEGITRTNLKGEIIILDSSSDSTPQIAKSMGVNVVHVKASGLGNAYKAGKEVAQGKVVIMGDADCTYDFREIDAFISKINEGYDLVLGNRFTGSIEKGSMPVHHRYFGSPGTSWIFKHVLGIPTGDIHCGIRALRRELFLQLPFTEGGWEYATEMIASSRNLNARISEIPINFYKEPEGRVSHHKRNGWLTPFRAGWGTLRVTATFSFDRILTVPGALLSIFAVFSGLLIAALPTSIRADLHLGTFAQFLLFSLSAVGSLAFAAGNLAHFIYFEDSPLMKRVSNQRHSEILFAVFTLLTLVVCVIFAISISDWISGFQTGVQTLQEVATSRLIFLGISLAALDIAVFAVLVVAMVSNYLTKMQSSKIS